MAILFFLVAVLVIGWLLASALAKITNNARRAAALTTVEREP